MESNDSNQIPNKRVGTFYNITYKYSSPKKLVSSWSTTYAKIVLYYIFSIQTLNSDELLNLDRLENLCGVFEFFHPQYLCHFVTITLKIVLFNVGWGPQLEVQN